MRLIKAAALLFSDDVGFGIWMDLASTLQLGLSSPFYCRLCMIFLLACGIRYVGHFGKNTARGFVEKNLRKSRRVSCCLCRAEWFQLM